MNSRKCKEPEGRGGGYERDGWMTVELVSTSNGSDRLILPRETVDILEWLLVGFQKTPPYYWTGNTTKPRSETERTRIERI